MLNKMCENCLCLGKDCEGSKNQVWSSCIYKKTVKDLEKLLENECKKYENDCTKCPYRKECDEYAKLA